MRNTGLATSDRHAITLSPSCIRSANNELNRSSSCVQASIDLGRHHAHAVTKSRHIDCSEDLSTLVLTPMSA